MSSRLLLATRNQGKITEFKRILDAIAPGAIELVGLDQFPNLHDVDETGRTFQENALLKAREMSEATGLPAIADDSGLCVDALNGDPGIYSARWSGVHGDDHANLEKVLDQLKDVPDEKRGAYFICVAALYMPGGANHCEEGRFHGWILHSPVGENGFGYDPIFRPDGLDISSAQMSSHEKDAFEPPRKGSPSYRAACSGLACTQKPRLNLGRSLLSRLQSKEIHRGSKEESNSKEDS